MQNESYAPSGVDDQEASGVDDVTKRHGRRDL